MKSFESLSSLSNFLVKKICKLKTDGALRQEEKLTIVEGKNLLKDLLSKRDAAMLFVTEKNRSFSDQCAKSYLVSDEVMKKISTVDSPEGILALFPIEEAPLENLRFPCLILDGIQDPGNMGTLLRTASAFNVQNCAVIEPACDLWHPKVMRAAKGAHYFFEALVTTTWDKILPHIEEQGGTLCVATLHAPDIENFSVPKKWALVIGSETQGPTVPEEAETVTFTIPIAPYIESLNAAQAGAIALYVFTR